MENSDWTTIFPAGERLPAEAFREDLLYLHANFRVDPVAASRKLDALEAAASAAGDGIALAWASYFRGWLALDRQDTRTAGDLFDAAAEAFSSFKIPSALNRCENGIASVFMTRGAFSLALEHYLKAVDIAEASGGGAIVGDILLNVVMCQVELGQADQALRTVDRIMAEFPARPRNYATREFVAGLAYGAALRYAEAEACLRRSVAANAAYPTENLESKAALVKVLEDQGRVADASALADEGFREASEAGVVLSSWNFRLARARLRLAASTEAEGSALRASAADAELVRAEAELAANKPVEAEAVRLLSSIRQRQGDCVAALDLFVAYHALVEETRKEAASKQIVEIHEAHVRYEARLYEAMYRRLSAISDFGKRIAAFLDPDRMLDAVAAAVGELVSAERLLLVLSERGGRVAAWTTAGAGKSFVPSPAAVQEARALIDRNGRGLEAWTAADLSDAAFLPGAELPVPRNGSLVFCPLQYAGEWAGVLAAWSPASGAYATADADALSALGAYVAIAWENASLYRQVRDLARLDSLTGILNRRAFFDQAGEELARMRRYGEKVALVMFDLDDFKSINDRGGHAAGDRALYETGKLLRSVSRETDLCGRYGGEEFVALLPETGGKGGECFALRVREGLKAVEIDLGAAGRRRLAASFGVAEIRADESLEAALGRADALMYAAKAAGKDRVVAEEEAGAPT